MSLSMRQLAEMAQVSNPYLSQIERGVYKPSAQVLKGIADALDMSAETLYREAGLLDDAFERPAMSVADAIRVDPRLTQEGKQALIQVYQGLIAAQPAPQPPTARAPRSPAAASRTRAAKPASSTPAKPAQKTTAKAPVRKTQTRKAPTRKPKRPTR
jgi:transcriptional regulator with XRE-family HTH domain